MIVIPSMNVGEGSLGDRPRDLQRPFLFGMTILKSLRNPLEISEQSLRNL